MNSITRLFSLLIIICTSALAGDVVVCADSSLEVAEQYEAKVLQGATFSPIETASDAVGPRVRKLLAKIASVDSLFAQSLGDESRALAADIDTYRTLNAREGKISRFLSENLVDPIDRPPPILPNGCLPAEAIVRRTPKFPEDKTFYLDWKLIDRLSPDQLASLILHEAILAHFNEGKDTGSDQSRWMSSWVRSNGFPVGHFFDYAMGSLVFDRIRTRKILYRGIEYWRHVMLKESTPTTLALKTDLSAKHVQNGPLGGIGLYYYVDVSLTRSPEGVAETGTAYIFDFEWFSPRAWRAIPGQLPPVPLRKVDSSAMYYLAVVEGKTIKASFDPASRRFLLRDVPVTGWFDQKVEEKITAWELVGELRMDLENVGSEWKIRRLVPAGPTKPYWKRVQI